MGELSRAIQKRQCLRCAGRKTHAEDRSPGSVPIGSCKSAFLSLRLQALQPLASPVEDFISQDAKARGRPEGCFPSAGHDGGVGDFHHGGFHFGLHLQRCVFPQRQQQRGPRRCRAPRRGRWSLQPSSRAGASGRAGNTRSSPPRLPGRPEGLVTRAAPAPGELLLPRAPSPPGWAPSLSACRLLALSGQPSPF